MAFPQLKVHLRAELVLGKLSACQVTFPSFHCHLPALFRNGLTHELLGQVPNQQGNLSINRSVCVLSVEGGIQFSRSLQ